MTDRDHRHSRALVRGVALVVALLLAVTACAQATSSPPPGTAAPTTADGAQPTTPPVTTAPPIPDVLPDPSVAPGECKLVTYTPATSTEPHQGELCRPKERQRDVAIMVIHGGSGISGSYANMRRWANRYLIEGYVTFLPSYHLFNVGGETPVFPHPEQNIKAAVQYLRGTGNALGINKERIVVQGQSAGARVGAVAFTTPDDPWFAGPELHAGVSDRVNGFIGFYHPYDGTMQFADQYFGGPETSTKPEVLERIAKGDSLAQATNAVGPALFITGSKDWSIIVEQQNAFAGALQHKLVAANTSVIDGGGHGFDEGGARLSKLGEQAAVETLMWLNHNFPQLPARDFQNADADVANAPTYTGEAPTTYRPRPTTAGGYTAKAGSSSGGGGGGSGGGGVATTGAPTTAEPAPSTSEAPVTTGAPVTTSPPTTSTPPTTGSPPTTSSPPTTPVITAPPTTPPTVPTGGGGGGGEHAG